MFEHFRQRLVVMRGAARPDRTELARALAETLPAPAAALPHSSIATGWIVRPSRDHEAELALTYRLLKLVGISLLKEGYSVVVDAPYAGAAGDQDLADLAKLARTFRGVRVTLITFLPEGDGAETAAVRDALRHAAQPDEVLVEGSGGSVREFAERLADRIRQP